MCMYAILNSYWEISEKDELLVRNASLSQEFESYKRTVQEEKTDLQKEVKDKETAIAGLEAAIENIQKDVQQHQELVRWLIIQL